MFVFFLGWILNDVLGTLQLEHPDIITGSIVSSYPKERASPSDIIKKENIHIYADRIVIDVDGPEWATFADTNSMDPVIDIGSNALQIVPQNESQIQVGDIISYNSNLEYATIIHRVINIGHDDGGWYAVTKGDNNPSPDPEKIRFKQVKKLLIGIIY